MITDVPRGSLDSMIDYVNHNGLDRQDLVYLISNGLTLPSAIKSMAYIMVIQLPQSRIDDLSIMAKTCLEYLAHQDLAGLREYLMSRGIPNALVDYLVSYGDYIINQQQ